MPSGLDALQSSGSVESPSIASPGPGASLEDASPLPIPVGRSPSKIDESHASAHERVIVRKNEQEEERSGRSERFLELDKTQNPSFPFLFL
jgi:hypothetical protein